MYIHIYLCMYTHTDPSIHPSLPFSSTLVLDDARGSELRRTAMVFLLAE